MKPPFIVVIPALRVNGIAIFPFIFVKRKFLKQDAVLIRHETIHLKQELELLLIPFYALYLINYIINLIRYKNHKKAYLNIVFEREAYTCEEDIEYLKQRKAYSWLRFLSDKKEIGIE